MVTFINRIFAQILVSGLWKFAYARRTSRQINLRETRQYLKESDFENLFTQALGWDNYTQTLNIRVDETAYQLTAIAEKRGMVVFECLATGTDGRIPDYATRRKIQKQVAKLVHENFIIYTDGFTDQELDFIINYDIKYRTGLGNWRTHTCGFREDTHRPLGWTDETETWTSERNSLQTTHLPLLQGTEWNPTLYQKRWIRENQKSAQSDTSAIIRDSDSINLSPSSRP